MEPNVVATLVLGTKHNSWGTAVCKGSSTDSRGLKGIPKMAAKSDGKKQQLTKKMCRTKSCGKPMYVRGVCRCCYVEALRRIAAGEVTAEQLEELGLWLPSQRGRTQNGVPFQLQLEAALKRQKANENEVPPLTHHGNGRPHARST